MSRHRSSRAARAPCRPRLCVALLASAQRACVDEPALDDEPALARRRPSCSAAVARRFHWRCRRASSAGVAADQPGGLRRRHHITIRSSRAADCRW